MKDKRKLEHHELMYGPHFNQKCAEKVVEGMKNEDGSKGAHWNLEETTQLAQQYNINLKGEEFNKYDWFVALNMVRSDFYRAIVNITNSDHVKYFIELAKAWINDKDIDEGKMWYYYKYVMCDAFRDDYEDEEDDDYEMYRHLARRGRMHRDSYYKGYDYYDDEDDDDDDHHDKYRTHHGSKRISKY